MTFATREVWTPSAADLRWGRPLWWTVGPCGELAVLMVRRRDLERMPYVKGWVGWRPTVPFDAVLILRRADGSMQRRTIGGIQCHPNHIAVLPDGRLLLVSGRAARDDLGSWAANAVVYSPEGGQQAAFCVGDDIDVLITDQGGSIWTAYGDEGIYGHHPQSAAGLAGWSPEGEATWAPGRRLPAWPLAGCAAATESDHVWMAWYSGQSGTFLTQIIPATGEVTSRLSPVCQPDGLAVRGDRAVLTRRHHNKPSTEVTLARLVGESWTVTDQRTVRVPGRVVLRCGQGRDGVLWLRAGDTWLHLEA